MAHTFSSMLVYMWFCGWADKDCGVVFLPLREEGAKSGRFNPVCHLNVFGASLDGAFLIPCTRHYPELPHQLLLFLSASCDSSRPLSAELAASARMLWLTSRMLLTLRLISSAMPALLLRRPRDLLVHLVDGADRLDDLLQHADRQLHLAKRVTSAWLWPVRIAFCNRLGAGLQLGDQRLDLDDGVLGAARQIAHLVRHHGEPRPCSAGPRRLDGGVERSTGWSVRLSPWITTRMSLMLSLLAAKCSTTGLASLITVISLDAGLLCLRHHGLALLGRHVRLIGRTHRRVRVAGHLQGGGGSQLLERRRHQVHLLILGLHAGTGPGSAHRTPGRAGQVPETVSITWLMVDYACPGSC